MTVIVESRPNSDSQTWVEVPQVTPDEVASRNAQYGWRKYRTSSTRVQADPFAGIPNADDSLNAPVSELNAPVSEPTGTCAWCQATRPLGTLENFNPRVPTNLACKDTKACQARMDAS